MVSRMDSEGARHPLQAGEYHPAGKLARRVALVTGAEGGAGRAVAILYAREGADLCLIVTPEAHAAGRETQAEVSLSGGRCLLIAGDPLDGGFCRRVVAITVEALGRLDIVVNAPSLPFDGSPVPASAPPSLPPVREGLPRHLFGSLEMVRASLDHLEPGSAVINTGSFRGTDQGPPRVADSVSRGALLAFTRSLATALAPSGVRVNCVDPGSGAPGPLPPCPPRPEDVAPTFVYLAANPDSRYVTGEVVTIRGREPEWVPPPARSTSPM
jgi:NAD(P)-dependent dehydrogenase (short-subunit alcohol dehydrogenase family)